YTSATADLGCPAAGQHDRATTRSCAAGRSLFRVTSALARPGQEDESCRRMPAVPPPTPKPPPHQTAPPVPPRCDPECPNLCQARHNVAVAATPNRITLLLLAENTRTHAPLGILVCWGRCVRRGAGAGGPARCAAGDRGGRAAARHRSGAIPVADLPRCARLAYAARRAAPPRGVAAADREPAVDRGRAAVAARRVADRRVAETVSIESRDGSAAVDHGREYRNQALPARARPVGLSRDCTRGRALDICAALRGNRRHREPRVV